MTVTPEHAAAAANAARWATMETLFHDALEVPAAERSAWLLQACTDNALRADVQALIDSHDRRGVLDALVDDVMTAMLPQRGAAAPTTPATNPLLPAHSRYRVIERIGKGGMGVVYRARDERLDRDIAMKFLSSHLSADPGAKKRFLIEARAAAAIEHPNICTVHEIGDTDDGQLYIVMACYDGETLDRTIARGPLPTEEALRIAGEIARGLAKAHERGIVHRDIKPANVMVTADGLVKILDFGIAKLSDVTSTQTVGAIGTVAYMSPEQAFGETVDHRADIWSLGVVLYEMVTGVRPFRGGGDQAVLVAALSAEPPVASALRSDVPDGVDLLIQHMLAKRPADRVANAPDLLAAIAACMTSRMPGAVAAARAPAANSAASAALDTPSPGKDEPRDSALARGGERRQVTVVACTIDGQDALVERLAPEHADRVLAQVREAAHAVATEYDGIVNQFAGDDVVMLFGVPQAHEDDALRGVRAAVELRQRVADIAKPLGDPLARTLRVRAGVHIGAVVAQRLRSGDRQFRISGTPADIAARLASAAESDMVLLSAETRKLVAPFVHTEASRPVVLPGDSAPVLTHRLLRMLDKRARYQAIARTGLTPFVGRVLERAVLAEQVNAARVARGHVSLVVGEAGAGKSRLLDELRELATAQSLRVVVGRCDAYGGSTPFLPFVDAAHDLLGLPSGGTAAERHEAAVSGVRRIDRSLEQYLPFYLALLAIPSEAHPVPEALRGERFHGTMLKAIGALYTLAANSAPMLLLLEDWHWADDASRVALRQLAEIVPAIALLAVVTSRPEGAADWGSSEHQTLMHLSPLDGTASAEIAGAVFKAQRVAPALVARLHERTGGNPFFLEELCEALREEGSVTVRDGEAMTADASGALHVPETVQGVLRTRMDRLDVDARETLRVAAVIGREFTRGVLEDVSEAPASLSQSLERLKGSGLVQQIAIAPEAAYRFKHALTEEVAYDSLLQHQRKTLHEAVGRAIEQRYATHLDEHVDRLAHHFSRADAWADAVRYGVQSADRAMGLSQNADALHMLERAEEWVRHLPDDESGRDRLADVLLRQERLCELLGLRSRQLSLVEALISLLAPHGPSHRLAQVYLRQGDAYTLLQRYEAAERALETALRIARERADGQSERNALRSMAFLRSHEGRHDDALEKIEEVMTLGRLAGDTRAQAGDLATMGNILRALGQFERALSVLEAALERTQVSDHPARYGALLNVMGSIHRDLGNLDTALDYLRRTKDYMSITVYASFTQTAVAHIQLQQGLVDEALETYQDALRLNRTAGYVEGIALACRSLGEVLVGLERPADAVPYLREAATLFAQIEDERSEVLMRRRLARAYEQLGQSSEACATWSSLRDLHHQRHDLSAEAEALEGMARAERQLHADTVNAVERYTEALQLAVRQGDRARELAIRNSLGIVYWQRADYGEAVREYETALRICRETTDLVHEGLILCSLGASLGKLRRWDEARTALNEAIRVTAIAGEQQLLGHARSALADVCVRCGRLREAQEQLDAALVIRQAQGDVHSEASLRARLAQVQQQVRATTVSPPSDDASSRRPFPPPPFHHDPDAALHH